jgi:two-component system, NarL family, sensor kinase
MTMPTDSPREQIQLLRRMVEDISSELALVPLLVRILDSACELLGADDGTIGLYDADKDVIRTAAVRNMPDRELGAEMRRGVGLAGQVLATGQPLLARYGDLPNITLSELNDNHVIGVPILWRGELVGFFGIGVHAPRRFQIADIATLDLFSIHAAIAIANARRYQIEFRRTSRFELIARVAGIINQGLDLEQILQNAADAVHELLEFPNVDIPLLDPDDPSVLIVRIRGGAYKRDITGVDRIPVSQGIMGAAIRERRTQLVNDIAHDARYVRPPGVKLPRAELAVPILLGGETLGVLNVEGDATFDEIDVASVEIVAEHLAVAINNARLFEQARSAAVLTERQRLARELHDNVTQVLSSISLLSQTLVSAWQRDPAEGERRAGRLRELAQTAFAEMRALLRELTPPEKPQTQISKTGRSYLGLEQLKAHALPGALTKLLAAMVPENIELRLDFAGYRPQQVELEQVLFRVCQEAVSNVVRHSGAKRLTVAALVQPTQVCLRVADDGRGIAADSTPGIGLSSMRQRIVALGGHFQITARAPRGTLLEARLKRRDRVAGPDDPVES